MPEYQKRVLDERDALRTKYEALSNFFGSVAFNKLPAEETERLGRQHNAMGSYLSVLIERTNAFK